MLDFETPVLHAREPLQNVKSKVIDTHVNLHMFSYGIGGVACGFAIHHPGLAIDGIFSPTKAVGSCDYKSTNNNLILEKSGEKIRVN